MEEITKISETGENDPKEIKGLMPEKNIKLSQHVLQQLTDRVPVERIFQFGYSFQENAYERLLIVLDSKVQASPATLAPSVDRCLAECEGLTYMLISSGELKTAIKGGHLFYSMVCSEQNQVYNNGRKPLIFPPSDGLEAMRVRAAEHFQNDLRKSADFREGVNFYKSQGNLQQAAFMLHQTAELALKGFCKAVFKKDKRKHSLQNLLKIAASFIPEILTLFHDGNEGLLKLLDKSYTSVRYQNNYHIEEEEIGELTRKIDLLLDWCNRFYQYCLTASMESATIPAVKQIDKTAVQSLPKSPDNKPQNRLNNILNKIRKDQQVLQFILLSARSASHTVNNLLAAKQQSSEVFHYHVLAIIPKSQSGRSRTITQNGLNVTLLFHQEDSVRYALGKHNRFFIEALSKGTLLYKNEEHPVEFVVPQPDWKHSYERAEKLMDYRLNELAKMFHESAEEISDNVDDGFIASTLLLSQCLEQVCLTYIYVQTGYRAERHDLGFLLDMCKLVSPEISNFFQQQSPGGKKQVNALVNCLQNIRMKQAVSLDYDDMLYWLQRVEEVIQIAETHCKAELERLKKLACVDQGESLPSELLETTQ